jgi:L-alanine-DL-glutamate epimerase-like enolase superfamily enzyme
MRLSGLKVKTVERIVVHVPFTPRCQVWNQREVWQWGISEVIRVTTNVRGLVGFGETLLHYTWGRVSEEAVQGVIGRNPAELLGDDRLGAGLQMALYDVVGKALEVPLYRLLNLPKVRDWCPISWWNIDMSPEALAEEAKEAVAHGYTSYKIKARPWWDIYAQVEAISRVTPPSFKLDLDWNQMLLTAGNAGPVLSQLDRYGRVAIYESPIFQRDVEGNRHLRTLTTRPIALHFGEPPFPTVARCGVCDGFVVSGGIASILRQAALADAFEMPFWLQMVGTGLTTALSLHLGAVLKRAVWPAVNCLNNFADDLLQNALEIVGGYARVPEGPGLGVEVDEEALTRYRMRPPHALPRPRLLLQVVWPQGFAMWYRDMQQCWDDFLAGNQPVQERGVRMETLVDDGSKEWAELFQRLQRGPIRTKEDAHMA